MTRSAEELAVVTVDRITAGGDGIARIDGLACFVPRTAPGDVAQIAFRRGARLARGRVLQLRDPSPHRTAPRCRHYEADRCGGCQLQHLDQPSQREARASIVADALRRIGRREVSPPALHSGTPWEYRGRLTLTVHQRGGRHIGGLHPYDDASRVFALEECPISHPALVAVWRAMYPLLRELPDAPVVRVALRLAEEERVVVVVQGGREWPARDAWSTRLRAAIASVSVVLWERGVERADRAATSRGATDGEKVDDLAPEAAEALAFAQVNREVAAMLRAHVHERVRAIAPAHLLDAYAGAGVLAEMVARDGVRVTAIESDSAATTRARERLGAYDQARVITARVEDALGDALPADVVVLNPPRRGVDERVTRLLDGARAVQRLIYVSCDPATLARDIARLPSWQIAELTAFDMFPQTAHVESVCVLTREVA